VSASVGFGRRPLRLRHRFGRPARFSGAASVAVLALGVVGALGGLVVASYHFLNGVVTSVGHGSGGSPELAAGGSAVALVTLGVFGTGVVERHPLGAAGCLLAAGTVGYAVFSAAWLATGVAFALGGAFALIAWIRGLRRAAAPPWSAEHWR
jgi:hypothetical protein